MGKTTHNLTITDVAQMAGCSVSTASRVLSESKYPVSEDMRTKILNAANMLGYLDNLKKRMLVNNQNPFFGIVVPTFQNPIYQQFINGIEQVARKVGYAAFILNSHRDVRLERQQINSLIQKRIGSLMLMSVDESPDTLRHYLDLGGFACIFESNCPDDHINVLSAKANRFEAGRIATEYLLSQGHRSIAFATTPLKHFQCRRLTLNGCRLAIEKEALPFSSENIFTVQEESESTTGQYEFETGYGLAERILQHPNRYTGVVCLNDMIAYGVIAGIKAVGAHVPNNISVIGIDNIPFNNFTTPSLTTVDVAAGMLAQRAAQLIIHMHQNQEDLTRNPLIMKPELVIRESVSKN